MRYVDFSFVGNPSTASKSFTLGFALMLLIWRGVIPQRFATSLDVQPLFFMFLKKLVISDALKSLGCD